MKRPLQQGRCFLFQQQPLPRRAPEPRLTGGGSASQLGEQLRKSQLETETVNEGEASLRRPPSFPSADGKIQSWWPIHESVGVRGLTPLTRSILPTAGITRYIHTITLWALKEETPVPLCVCDPRILRDM